MVSWGLSGGNLTPSNSRQGKTPRGGASGALEGQRCQVISSSRRLGNSFLPAASVPCGGVVNTAGRKRISGTSPPSLLAIHLLTMRDYSSSASPKVTNQSLTLALHSGIRHLRVLMHAAPIMAL